jgi:hypothetical protein
MHVPDQQKWPEEGTTHINWKLLQCSRFVIVVWNNSLHVLRYSKVVSEYDYPDDFYLRLSPPPLTPLSSLGCDAVH